MGWIITIVVLLVALWAIAILILAGPSLRKFDFAFEHSRASQPDDFNAEQKFLREIRQVRAQSLRSKSPSQGLTNARKFADSLSLDLETETTFQTIEFNGVEAEWAVAPNSNPKRRVLFFHGGAFILGSAAGHQKFSDRLSKICNASVLSVNYKLMPEHQRKAGILDAQAAYRWVLKNGPEGTNDCESLLVVGDSAGGNLAFMLSSWSDETKLQRPDAVIGFSPSLDSTISSKTILSNRRSDKLLGPSLGKLYLLPRPIFLWLVFLLLRTKPSNPLVSPIFYDLNNLPPTLIQASSSEMLLGEAILYTNKAHAAGSSVSLQVWENQLHDWQLFNMGQGSAEEAWQEVQKFVDQLE